MESFGKIRLRMSERVKEMIFEDLYAFSHDFALFGVLFHKAVKVHDILENAGF